MRIKIALIAAVLMLALVNYAIFQKEQLLQEGRVVYLELAPVDPRSLMQGDYMALRYAIARDLSRLLSQDRSPNADSSWDDQLAATDGRIVVELDEQSVARLVGLEQGSRLKTNQLYMQYRVRDGEVKFATNAFFFQEGDGELYETARYGRFRVDQAGQLLLTGMMDADLKLLGERPPSSP